MKSKSVAGMLLGKLKKFKSYTELVLLLLIVFSIILSTGIALSNAIISMVSAFIVFLLIVILIVSWYRGD